MPTYVYETIPADPSKPVVVFELMQKLADAPLTHHPETGEPVRRVLTAPFIGGTSSKSSGAAEACDDSGGGCGMGACGMGGCGMGGFGDA